MSMKTRAMLLRVTHRMFILLWVSSIVVTVLFGFGVEGVEHRHVTVWQASWQVVLGARIALMAKIWER